MAALRKNFPPGIDYSIVYDTTPFISESITEVYETLFDAIVLVALVVLVFLQNWRSSLIPLIAVPVAIIGTFAAMAAIGFSLNNLTLFGLVLAIGIVVDDAIVVVEAVEHHIEYGAGRRGRQASRRWNRCRGRWSRSPWCWLQFIPCAFITGIIGQFFRQFALTIAVSTVISAFNSLTLSPALSAILLKRRAKGVFEPLPWFTFVPMGAWIGHKVGIHYGKLLVTQVQWLLGEQSALAANVQFQNPLLFWGPILLGAVAALALALIAGKPVNLVLGGLFRMFNLAFDWCTAAYTRTVSVLFVRQRGSALAVYGGLLALTYLGFSTTPTGFIPQQDKGYLLVNVQMPDAAAVSRTG